MDFGQDVVRGIQSGGFLSLAIGISGVVVALYSVAQSFYQVRRPRGQLSHQPPESAPSPPVNELTDPVRAAVRAELAANQKKSFWPNLRLNIFTNFITNLFFFVLGVVVTLLTTLHH